MPELPEVEVSRRGIQPWLEGQVVKSVVIRHPRLRWPIPAEVKLLEGEPIQRVERRAKYLLLYSTLVRPFYTWGCQENYGSCLKVPNQKNMTISI